MKRSDEFSRIARIRERLPARAAGVWVGPGDDAAVLAPTHEARVWSVDAAVEGVHFRREWAGFHDIGYRATMAALSDLAAMGATASGALLAYTLPASVDDEALYALVAGAQEACERCRCSVLGGNLAGGEQLSITTTAIGTVAGPPLRRTGARPDDWIGVTGPLGAAALGMHALRARVSGPDAARFALAWRRPRARIRAGEALRTRASAAIDISDGLLQDLGHLCEASGVGARVETRRVPRLEGHDALAARLGIEAWRAVLDGGDDYELLVSCADAAVLESWAVPIGRITAQAGTIEAIDEQGAVHRMQDGGYRHW